MRAMTSVLPKPKTLATNGSFQLVFYPDRLCCSVYTTENPQFKMELARSMKLAETVTRLFTKDQVRDAKARIQEARVSKTYGF